ncbi:unnamed protein product [Polarella glacialis]|uniref:tRNA (adenine(58)-N(1))-methyltransferase non-catalytic subunit TRM6 n=1 Tax=Polarella glacialis TaxID=89957 RepID=A0A813I488_POLGL|nr:unnamed protein product [Polarella glacialis]
MAFVVGNIPRGSHVVLRDGEGAQKVFFLGASCVDLRMGKYGPIPADSVLGVPYGATLRKVAGGKWERLRGGRTELTAEEAAEVIEDNRNLAQDNTAQKMTPEEVKALKGKLGGQEVVDALASSSTTFASKTKFAQEKYLKKKAQKHVQQVVLLRPTVMELCETYMKQSRNKVCGLRFDYLSSLLCHADVRSGARYFLLDCAAGLVTGAMAQQLAGCGEIFRVFRGGCPEKALAELDMVEADRKTVRQLPLEVLLSADPLSLEWLKDPFEGQPAVPDAEIEAQMALRYEARLNRTKQRRADLEALKARPVDGLIIVAGDEDPDLASEALQTGLAMLIPGGRVVVYGQHLQPVAALQGSWRASGQFVDVRLEQLFTREYQVLPQRTHPHMAAESQLCEGYILSASKVVDHSSDAPDRAEPVEQAGPRKRRRQ